MDCGQPNLKRQKQKNKKKKKKKRVKVSQIDQSDSHRPQYHIKKKKNRKDAELVSFIYNL